MSDQYWDDVVLLLQPKDTDADGSTSIIDRSSSNHQISVFGDAQVDTSLGYHAVQFDGSGDYLTIPYSTDFDISGAYTIEALVYVPSFSPSFQIICCKGANLVLGVVSPGTLYVGVYVNDSNRSAQLTSTISTNTLHHIEIDFNPGNPTYIFVDGIFKGSIIDGTVGNQSVPLYIGRYNNYTDKDLNGLLRLRFTSNIARHVTTDTFSPPSTFEVTEIQPISLTINIDEYTDEVFIENDSQKSFIIEEQVDEILINSLTYPVGFVNISEYKDVIESTVAFNSINTIISVEDPFDSIAILNSTVQSGSIYLSSCDEVSISSIIGRTIQFSVSDYTDTVSSECIKGLILNFNIHEHIDEVFSNVIISNTCNIFVDENFDSVSLSTKNITKNLEFIRDSTEESILVDSNDFVTLMFSR